MNTGQPARPLTVLLAEDSPVQAQLVQIIIGEIDELELIATVEDGRDVLAYLHREGEHADAKRPDLVLLDINMPDMDGFETLEKMKADPELRSIPVVMLTTSDADEDIVKSYEHGASTFLQKPVDPSKMQDVLKHFASYWTAAKLPPE